jgi:hypothetical protein
LASHVLFSACDLAESTVEEGVPRSEANRLGDRGLEVTVSRVVDGDTIEIAPTVDSLDEVHLIGRGGHARD